MKQVTSNPIEEWGNDKLKRRFANTYADTHVHGIRDGVLVLSYLNLMEKELMERGIDPENVIGPKVISSN